MEDEILGTEKEFVGIFKTLCYSRSSWEVWADIITAMACSISNSVDRTPERFEKHEREYEKCIGRLGSVQVVSKLFAIIVIAMDKNQEQDFLGELYMALELGNHWKGQFFTPYSVCRCMAEISIGDEATNEIEKKGYLSINDPACGAGATLIAAANVFRSKHVDYQRDVLFVGQDIDRIVGMMCYIQLSLLGCPGYVAIANTLTNPLTGSTLIPNQTESQELWFTPFYFRNVWNGRRLGEILGLHRLTNTDKKQEINFKREEFFIFFEFNKEEEEMSDNAKTLQFSTGSEKLKYEEDELLKSVTPEYKEVMKTQFDNVFEELIKKSDEDPEFNNKVLLEHKSFKRCMKYASEKAMGMRKPSDKEKTEARNGTPIVTPVGSDILFGWVYEYYDLDDKDAVEKEKAKAKEKSKPIVNIKAVDSKEKSNAAKTVKTDKNAAKMQQKEPKPAKKTEMDGQLSLLDLFK